MAEQIKEALLRKNVADAERTQTLIRLLNWRQVGARVNRSRSWLFDAVRRGRFVEPIVAPDLPGRCLWEEASVQAWLEAQIAAGKEQAKTKTRTAPDSARVGASRRKRETAEGRA